MVGSSEGKMEGGGERGGGGCEGADPREGVRARKSNEGTWVGGKHQGEGGAGSGRLSEFHEKVGKLLEIGLDCPRERRAVEARVESPKVGGGPPGPGGWWLVWAVGAEAVGVGAVASSGGAEVEMGSEEGGLAAKLEQREADEIGVEAEVEGRAEEVGPVEVRATEGGKR